MARVTPRTAAAILGVTLVASVGGGYAWSRINGTDDPVVEVETAGTYDQPSGGIPTAPKVAGDPLPAATLQDMSGNDIEISSLVGKPMVINVWFSTCEPCKKELRDFAAVHAELGDQVRFIGIDPQDTASKASSFAAEHGVKYELYLDDGSFSASLKLAGYPSTLFVGADGHIVELHTGAFTADTLRAAITKDLLS